MLWEIRAEPAESVPVRKNEKPISGIKIRYRRLGSRGRFKSFVFVGDLPPGKSIFDVVTAYEASYLHTSRIGK